VGVGGQRTAGQGLSEKRDAVLHGTGEATAALSNAAEITVTLAASTGLLNWFEIAVKLKPITNSAGLAAANRFSLYPCVRPSCSDRGLR